MLAEYGCCEVVLIQPVLLSEGRSQQPQGHICGFFASERRNSSQASAGKSATISRTERISQYR